MKRTIRLMLPERLAALNIEELRTLVNFAPYIAGNVNAITSHFEPALEDVESPFKRRDIMEPRPFLANLTGKMRWRIIAYVEQVLDQVERGEAVLAPVPVGTSTIALKPEPECKNKDKRTLRNTHSSNKRTKRKKVTSNHEIETKPKLKPDPLTTLQKEQSAQEGADTQGASASEPEAVNLSDAKGGKELQPGQKLDIGPLKGLFNPT